jgi:RNA polymerase sigma factor (sigma-70 family)
MAETEAVLLQRFAGGEDAQAFAEIVRRHAGLVYGAALRILADVDRASDIAQETFLQLTQDAGSVTGSLPGWLHRVATHKAINRQRQDASRRRRERRYATERPSAELTEWKDVSPHVDVALRELDAQLREVLILHFLEGRSTREIAVAQGTSQATVSRRIGCGVEQLRTTLQRHGIIVGAGALSTLLGDNAVQAAPLSLLAELGKMAVVTEAAGTASSLTVTVAGAVTAVKSHAVAAAAVVIIGAGAVVTYQQAVRSPPKPSVAPPARSIVSSVSRRTVRASPAPQSMPTPAASIGARDREATMNVAVNETGGSGREMSLPLDWGSQPKVAKAVGRKAEPQTPPQAVTDGTVVAIESEGVSAREERLPRGAGGFVATARVRPPGPPHDPNDPNAPGRP